MTNSQKQWLEIVQDVAEETGFTLHPDYSGRNMDGERCVGIVTPTPEAVGIVIKAAKRRGLRGHKRDALGLGAIIYWPHVQMAVSATTEATNWLKDYLHGYGRGQVDRLDQLASLMEWEMAASQELQARQYSLTTAFDDELLALIRDGQVRVQEVARAVAQALKPDGAKRESVPESPPGSDPVRGEVFEAMEEIARRRFGIISLEEQYSDGQDFHDVNVGSLRRALYDAYALGLRSASKGRKP